MDLNGGDALPAELRVTVTLYLEAISRGDRENTLSEVFSDGALQPFGHVRTENGRVSWKLINILYQDTEKAVLTMARQYPAIDQEPDPDLCVITAEYRPMGWLITKACLTDLHLGIEGAWDLLYEQLAQMRTWELEKNPLTEEDLKSAAQAAFRSAAGFVFLNQYDPEEEREELAGSLEYEYDPQWAEHILVVDWLAGTVWAKDPKWDASALDAGVKEMVLWVCPTDGYRTEHPEVGVDVMGRGSGSAGWYFHCQEAAADTMPPVLVDGWTAGPVVWSADEWMEEDGFPHNRASEP